VAQLVPNEKWRSVTPQVPEGIQALGQSVTSALSALRTGLEGVRVAFEAQALLVTQTESAAVLAANLALRTIIASINAALDVLLDDTGLYLLPIPIPKKGSLRVAIDASSEGIGGGGGGVIGAVFSNPIDYPINDLFLGSEEQKAEMRKSYLLQQLLRPTDLFTGGNAYLIKTIAESIYDEKDQNRPVFSDGSYWGYGFFVAGASDVTALLGVGLFFDRIIGELANATQVGASRGLSDVVPRGVTVLPSGRTQHAVVSWELVAPSTLLSSFDNSTIDVYKFAVIRAKDERARTATRVTDLFSTRRLTEGLTGIYESKVLLVRDYDGIVTRYVDSSDLEEGVTYYYFLAFATRGRPNSGSRTSDGTVPDFGFNKLSTGVEFRRPSRREDYGGKTLSKAPDWMRTPSVMAMIPPVSGFIDKIQEFLKTVGSTADNVSVKNQQYLDFLNREIDKYSAYVQEIEQRVAQINSIFESPDAGLYVTFRNGSGNATDFLADVVSSLEDATDPQVPPFSTGDEFVTGLVALAVGPDPAPIVAALELLSLLFSPAANVSPELVGIQSINTELAAVEAGLLAQLGGGTNSTLSSPNTFNADMTARVLGTGDSTCDP